MTSTTWIHAPAGALGRGFADARPMRVAPTPAPMTAAVAAPTTAPTTVATMPPLAAAVRTGIAVPTNGLPPVTRLRPAGFGFGPDLSGTAVIGVPCTPRGEYTAQHDGTTLGFHTPSRSVS